MVMKRTFLAIIFSLLVILQQFTKKLPAVAKRYNYGYFRNQKINYSSLPLSQNQDLSL